MIRHIVLFRVIEGTPIERMQAAANRLEALVGVIPGLRSLKAGIDIGIEGNFDFGLVAELEDRAALECSRKMPPTWTWPCISSSSGRIPTSPSWTSRSEAIRGGLEPAVREPPFDASA